MNILFGITSYIACSCAKFSKNILNTCLIFAILSSLSKSPELNLLSSSCSSSDSFIASSFDNTNSLSSVWTRVKHLNKDITSSVNNFSLPSSCWVEFINVAV